MLIKFHAHACANITLSLVPLPNIPRYVSKTKTYYWYWFNTTHIDKLSKTCYLYWFSTTCINIPKEFRSCSNNPWEKGGEKTCCINDTCACSLKMVFPFLSLFWTVEYIASPILSTFAIQKQRSIQQIVPRVWYSGQAPVAAVLGHDCIFLFLRCIIRLSVNGRMPILPVVSKPTDVEVNHWRLHLPQNFL